MKKENILAFFILGLSFLLIVPLSPFLLDILLTFSLAFSLITLLLTIFIEETVELSSFPSILLFLTLFRLGLNLASTRLILSDGQAGKIIETFGHFLTGSNPLLGLILFALLTTINFIVITKGAGRIAEVSARFTLEALPGKQMLLDAEGAAGDLSKDELKKARDKLAIESEFYGQMDGASKFVRGDAIAMLVIIFVNLLGGLFFAMTTKAMSLKETLSTYTMLTIGDGLVTQIPSLLISLAAGIILTKNSHFSIASSLPSQVISYPKVFTFCGLSLIAVALIPGMPKITIFAIAAIFLLFGRSKNQEQKKSSERVLFAGIEVQLGLNVLEEGEKLLAQIPIIREELATHLGFLIPSIHIKDNLSLSKDNYAIVIKGVKKFEGNIKLIENLKKTIIQNACELVTFQDIIPLIENAKEENSAAFCELEKYDIKTKELFIISQNLLRERVLISDFVTIVNTIAEHVEEKKDLNFLTEKVRQKLIPRVVNNFFDETNNLHAITVDSKVEQMLSASIKPKVREKIEKQVQNLLMQASEKQIKPVVLTSVNSRALLSKIVGQYISVFSYEELNAETEIKSLGHISTDVLI